MNFRPIFRILDADTDLEAKLSEEEGQEDFVVISQPDKATVVMSLAHFRSLAAAVERHTS